MDVVTFIILLLFLLIFMTINVYGTVGKNGSIYY